MHYDRGVAVDRMSIALSAELGHEVRQAASRSGSSVSGWIGQAVADRLRNEELGRVLDEWEAEHGAFTSDELDQAERDLGLGTSPRHGTAH